MDSELKKNINRWIGTASSEQLQAAVVEIEDLIGNRLPYQSPAWRDARDALRRVESELVARATVKRVEAARQGD